MSLQSQQFFLVFRSHSAVIHEEELDFNALIHDVAFSAVCTGRLANDGRWEPVRIDPERAGGSVEGVTVHVAGFCRTYGRAVFNDRAGEILRSCRRAMGAAARLLIVEGVYPARIDQSDESRGAASNDVNMLVCTGGRQRSEAEFRTLYAAAGFRLTRIIPTPTPVRIIEGAGV